MRNLLNFLLRYNYWIVFLLLEAVCFVLLFRFNRYQQSVFFTSAGTVSGTVYRLTAGVTSYFHLKAENDDLLARNLWLEHKVAALEEMLDVEGDSAWTRAALPGIDTVFGAHVIKNSLTLPDNYITLNKGEADGIRPEMGVVGPNGVVGIVYKTSARYALVMSLLNSKSNLSCRIVGSHYFGYLKWTGGDSQVAYLRDLPRHAEFSIGDTVVTSGYSAVFPEGLMVGVIDSMSDSHDGLSYLLKIRLATDFGRLNNVRVLSRERQDEQHMLENTVNGKDNGM